VLRDFRGLNIALAHGGRGWWYDAAAFMALSNERVWIELSGLPPAKLRTYYARHDWSRLTRKMIFGTDWPGVPGHREERPGRRRPLPRRGDRRPGPRGNAARVYNLKISDAAPGQPASTSFSSS
jgi:predicted TIM-barrel fold metal-dependent hydrolase